VESFPRSPPCRKSQCAGRIIDMLLGVEERGVNMSLGNVNAKILIEKVLQDYSRSQILYRDASLVKRRIKALELYYFKGWTMREIADLYGISTGTIQKDLSRILNIFKYSLIRQHNIKGVEEAMMH